MVAVTQSLPCFKAMVSVLQFISFWCSVVLACCPLYMSESSFLGNSLERYAPHSGRHTLQLKLWRLTSADLPWGYLLVLACSVPVVCQHSKWILLNITLITYIINTIYIYIIYHNKYYWTLLVRPKKLIPGSSVRKKSACSEGGPGLIPGLGRSPGEGNSNPLQYSYLENLMDRRD